MITNLEVSVFLHIIGPHAVEDEVSFIGHTHNVVACGVRKQPVMGKGGGVAVVGSGECLGGGGE